MAGRMQRPAGKGARLEGDAPEEPRFGDVQHHRPEGLMPRAEVEGQQRLAATFVLGAGQAGREGDLARAAEGDGPGAHVPDLEVARLPRPRNTVTFKNWWLFSGRATVS